MEFLIELFFYMKKRWHYGQVNRKAKEICRRIFNRP